MFRYVVIRGKAIKNVKPMNIMLRIISKRNVESPRVLFFLNFVLILGLLVSTVSMNMNENTFVI